MKQRPVGVVVVTYSNSRDAQGELISGGIAGAVELLDGGTALKATVSRQRD